MKYLGEWGLKSTKGNKITVYRVSDDIREIQDLIKVNKRQRISLFPLVIKVSGLKL